MRNQELTTFQAFSNTRLCKFLDQKVCSDYGRKYVELTLVFHLCLDGYLIHLRVLHNKFKGRLRLNLFQVTEHCCSVAKSCPTLCDPIKHTRLPCPSLSPWVCSDSCPLSQWCLWSPMVLLNSMAWFSGHHGFKLTRIFPSFMIYRDLVLLFWHMLCNLFVTWAFSSLGGGSTMPVEGSYLEIIWPLRCELEKCPVRKIW